MPALLSVVLFSLVASCTKKKEENKDILLTIGDMELTAGEVIEKIPSGLSETDSINLFNSIVDSWIKDNLLSAFAEDHLINTEEIDRMVKEYRDKLIVQEYLTKMRETRSPKSDEKAVKDYYETHKKDLKTEMPLIKGIFIKIYASSPKKEEIKSLLNSGDDENIDLLEQNYLNEAIAYDYFKDRWIDWESVSGLIPYRFGNADKFIADNKFFENDHGDFTYMLLISDYLPSGSEQPFEYASEWIKNILNRVDINQYESKLVESLIKKSIKENKLQIVSYDPITHERR